MLGAGFPSAPASGAEVPLARPPGSRGSPLAAGIEGGEGGGLGGWISPFAPTPASGAVVPWYPRAPLACDAPGPLPGVGRLRRRD